MTLNLSRLSYVNSQKVDKIDIFFSNFRNLVSAICR